MDDITRMAREAGLCRNKLATWMIAQGYATGHGDTIEGLLEELEWQVRESERKAMLHLALLHGAPWHFQEAIRARGQA
jgi:hypothetical protein